MCAMKNMSKLLKILSRSFSDKKAFELFTETKIAEKVLLNEQVFSYRVGSRERCELQETIEKMACCQTEIPIVIGEEEYKSPYCRIHTTPFEHNLRVAQFYHADSSMIHRAMDMAICSQKLWSRVKWEDRLNIFQKAAMLITGKYRQQLNAAAVLGQAKNVMQSEIDTCCLGDVVNANCAYLVDLLQYKPMSPQPTITKNHYQFRGCEGFWAAISPFNSIEVAGDLATAPILMGNAVVWRPSDASILSNWMIFKIFREAGLPSGLLNFIPCDEALFRDVITSSYNLAGVNFAGTAKEFNKLWSKVGTNVESFRNYPRLVGQTGGKNYHFVHCSADCTSVVNHTIRAAYEYAGQKSSSCSIIYVPSCLYCQIKDCLEVAIRDMAVCHSTHFTSFMSSVIDGAAYDRIRSYLDYARACPNLEIIIGGCCDDTIGFYVEPTLIACTNHYDILMKEEISGPVLMIYSYNECEVENMLKTIVTESPYALTASIFSKDDEFTNCAFEILRMTAGNIYINDKCTGAVPGQQPYGGTRGSGTNDKTGGPHYLLRFANGQAIKQTFVDLIDYNYPYMDRRRCC